MSAWIWKEEGSLLWLHDSQAWVVVTRTKIAHRIIGAVLFYTALLSLFSQVVGWRIFLSSFYRQKNQGLARHDLPQRDRRTGSLWHNLGRNVGSRALDLCYFLLSVANSPHLYARGGSSGAGDEGMCACVSMCSTGMWVRRVIHAPDGFLSQKLVMGTSAPWMASSSQINNHMTQRLKAQKISHLHWPTTLTAANLEPVELSPALCFPPPSVSSSRTHETP